MKEQIIVSGTGGQGVLFLTRLLAESGLEAGLAVLTSETHGMAMRGGTVISHVKVGPFMSPMVQRGRADAGLFLTAVNYELHRSFVKPGGSSIVNTPNAGPFLHVDATAEAREVGSLLVTNLVLLGFAVAQEALFCDAGLLKRVIAKISLPQHRELNAKGFERGLQLKGGK